MSDVKRELRLALGMRGGVSLAIWIGGACSEIDRVRRADTGGGDFWSRLLAASDYDRAIVDVIAGASAGGLNGVLYASSQQYGFDLDEVRQTWLEVADLQQLVRADDPRFSLLDGDTRFLDVLHDQLARLIGDRPPPQDAPRLDVQLSATLVEPISRSAPSPLDERGHDIRYSSRFHFAHDPRVSWAPSGFPRDDTGRSAVIDKLALAGRATSSFPFAFEPAVVRSTRPETFVDDEPPPSTGRHVDMRGVFADVRGRPSDTSALVDDDFVVADGGILDNIPLGKAISAIADATADTPTKRYLVYLHPTGPTEEDPTEAEPVAWPPASLAITRRSAVGVLRGAFASRMMAETTLGDIAQMEELNRSGELAAAMRRATFDPMLEAGTTIVECARSVFDRYQLERSVGDARAVDSLLADPLASIGDDTFPRRIAGRDDDIDDDRWRAPIATWPSARRTGLGRELVKWFEHRLTELGAGRLEDVFTAGTGPLERLLRLLIDWARYLDENHASPAADDGVEPGAARERFYDALAFVRRELALPRDLAWVTCAAADTVDDDWVKRSLDTVDRLVSIDGAEAEILCRELCDPALPIARQAFARTARERLHRLLADATADADGSDDLRTEIVDRVLVPTTLDLASCTFDGEIPEPDSPAALLHRALSEPSTIAALANGGDEARRVLAAVEVLCYQEFFAGAPCTPIEFVRMSAANRTPLNDRFEALVEHDEEGKPKQLKPARKLAGNELMNFAAFAKTEWRANDWMWGRLDAATTLVDLLVTPSAVQRLVDKWPPPDGPGSPDPFIDAIGALTHEGAATPAWGEFLRDTEWTQRCAAVRSTRAAYARSSDADTLEALQALTKAVRDAVLARRHWEILSEELGKRPWNDPPGRLDPDATVEAVATHAVGLDTFRTRPVDAHVALFKRMSDAAGRTVALSMHAQLHPGAADQPPGAISRWTGGLVRRGGRVATEAMLRPRRLLAKVAVGVAAIVAAIVGLIAWR